MLGTSGQQHLHQQTAVTYGVHSSQLASSVAAKSHHHISVSRAHSFPKTSPLAMVSDYQVRAGSQGVTRRAPNVTLPHACSTNNSSSSSSSQSHSSTSQKISSGASHLKSSGKVHTSGQAAASPDSTVQVQEKAGRRSPINIHPHSPKNLRKATSERVAKHAVAIAGLANGRDATVPPPVATRSSSQQQQQSPSSNPSPSAHSMLTAAANITPPNKVVGATVDELPVGVVSDLSSYRDREHKDHERRDKDKDKVSKVDGRREKKK